MGVTLLGCFSILRFEIIKMNFKNSYETRMGLALLARQDVVTRFRVSLVRLQKGLTKNGCEASWLF